MLESMAKSSRRRRDGTQRHSDILEAALRCFDHDGVLETGIEMIRKEANASPSSVYNLFANKQEIVLALLLRVFSQLLPHIASRLAPTKSAQDAVHTLVQAHIDWIAAHPKEGRFMYQAMSLGPSGLSNEAKHTLAEHKRELLRPIATHFGSFIERGEMRALSPTMMDVVILGSTHEALRRWLEGEAACSPKMLKTMLPTIAWRSISFPT